MLVDMLFTWLVTAVGLGIVTALVAGVKAQSLRALLLAALILGLVNAFIRPVLWLLTLPLTVITFGLFALVINALMIRLTAAIVDGFEVKGFGSALLAAMIMALLGILGTLLLQGLLAEHIEWYYQHQSIVPGGTRV